MINVVLHYTFLLTVEKNKERRKVLLELSNCHKLSPDFQQHILTKIIFLVVPYLQFYQQTQLYSTDAEDASPSLCDKYYLPPSLPIPLSGCKINGV